MACMCLNFHVNYNFRLKVKTNIYIFIRRYYNHETYICILSFACLLFEIIRIYSNWLSAASQAGESWLPPASSLKCCTVDVDSC